MIAGLPMYDLPELTPATDRLWSAISDALRAVGFDAPENLSRDIPDLHAHWLRPDLLLSQTCGLPYRARLHDKVALVGTPDYGLPGCPPGHYHSVWIARSDDPRTAIAEFNGATLAYNDGLSQSGWAAPLAHTQAIGLHLNPGPCTGAHRRSAQVVAEGGADLAAIDAVTWALLAGREPALGQLKIVGQTPPSPGLPLIAALGRDTERLFRAVETAIQGLAETDRRSLHLRGIVRISPETYLSQPIPPNP